jgi:hypothetical protein
VRQRCLTLTKVQVAEADAHQTRQRRSPERGVQAAAKEVRRARESEGGVGGAERREGFAGGRSERHQALAKRQLLVEENFHARPVAHKCLRGRARTFANHIDGVCRTVAV